MLGSRGSGGDGVPCSAAHTGSPQARRQPGLQASRPSPRLSAASTATAPASRGTTAAAGRTGGVSLGTVPLLPPLQRRGLTRGSGRLVGAVAGDPASRRPGRGGQLAEAAQRAGRWAPGEAEAQGCAGGVVAVEQGDGDVPAGRQEAVAGGRLLASLTPTFSPEITVLLTATCPAPRGGAPGRLPIPPPA